MSSTQRTCCTLTLALLVAAAPAANAADDELPRVSLRGFGTLGAVHSSERNADFVSGFFQPNGAGATRRWAHTVDSRLGAQLDAKFSDKLTAVVQLVAQGQHDNSYTPGLEWANVKYDFTPDFYVRAGRTVTTQYMLSESRLVGYANPWVRPPQEVYGLVPLTNKDGVDAAYRLHFGDVTSTLRASYGFTDKKLPNGGRVKARDIVDLSSSAEYGPASLRVSYSTGRVDLTYGPLDQLDAALANFGSTAGAFGFTGAASQASALRQKYRFADEPISLLAVGAMYDKDEWVLMAEWAKFGGHSVLADSKAWYVTAGYRIREFTPHVTVARLTAERSSEPGIATAGLPPGLAAGAAAINGGLGQVVAGTTFAQRSIALGVRWDVARNTALKVQYDRLKLDADSSGRLLNVQPNFQRGGTVNVFSVAVDFVF